MITMNRQMKLNILKNYIMSNAMPILIDFIDGSIIPNSVILPANCDIKDLNGHYEGTNFVAPKWLNELDNKNILVIDNLDAISKDEQLKFKEILKYRKIATFDIPSNVVIILTAKKINKETINEEIYSLVAHL